MGECQIKIEKSKNEKIYRFYNSSSSPFFSFSCNYKNALLLRENEETEEIKEDISFDPSRSRILIDGDSISDWSVFSGFGLKREDFNKGAYGIYSADFPANGIIQIEVFPAKKVACEGDFDRYKISSSEENYKKCSNFLCSMVNELLNKSALYVYGTKKQLQFTGLDFDEKKKRYSEPMSNFIFFMIYAERIQRALESVMCNPHRVLVREYPLERLEKIVRADSRSVRNAFARTSEYQKAPSKSIPDGFKVNLAGDSFIPRRMEQSRCVESYDTPENLFVAFVARTFSIRLLAVIKWLGMINNKDHEIKNMQTLKQRLISFLSRAPFAALSQRTLQHARFPFRSKVFVERQGYVEIAKIWRIFERAEPFSKNLAKLFALRRYCDIFELLCYFRVIDKHDVQLQGMFSYAGSKEADGKTTPGEYQDMERGLNWGCRYEIGETAVLYNYPIPRFKKNLTIDSFVDIFERSADGCVRKNGDEPVYHQRPDILVMKKDNETWKIEKLIDAKFRNHSQGDYNFEKGCAEIQKYFWSIEDDLWSNPKTKHAEGLFIKGKTSKNIIFKTEIQHEQKEGDEPQTLRVLELRTVPHATS